MKIQKNKKQSRSKLILLAAISATVLVGGLIFYFSWQNGQESTPERPVNDVDYSGPSQEDIDSSQNAKKRGEPDTTQTVPSKEDPSKKSATVGIAFADKEGPNFEVRAFITNVIEGTGTCKAILTNGAKSVTRESKAFIDASSSQCLPIVVPISELAPAGDWTLIMTYDSPSSKGSTDPEVVKI